MSSQNIAGKARLAQWTLCKNACRGRAWFFLWRSPMQRMEEVQANAGKGHVVEGFPPDALNLFWFLHPYFHYNIIHKSLLILADSSALGQVGESNKKTKNRSKYFSVSFRHSFSRLFTCPNAPSLWRQPKRSARWYLFYRPLHYDVPTGNMRRSFFVRRLEYTVGPLRFWLGIFWGPDS